jgi:hypothetical protein
VPTIDILATREVPAIKPKSRVKRRRTLGNRSSFALALCLPLAGCAMQGTVERQTVEYNAAAAQMANDLTLLNIMRAEEELPIYYTSISRLTGSIQLTASGGFNAQIKQASAVNTTSAQDMVAKTTGTTTTTTTGMTGSSMTATPMGTSGVNGGLPAGGPTVTTGSGTSSTIATAPTSSLVNTVTDLASRAVTSGGNVYMPSIGGQIVTGPSFDINILDTQTFYQGILTEIPFSTVDNYLDQEYYDNQLLIRLLVDRLEFRLKNPVDLYQHPVGMLAKVMHNVPSGMDEDGNDMAEEFANEVACFRLTGLSEKKPDKTLAPLSRLTENAEDKQRAIRIQDLAAFDGTKLEIDRPIPENRADDHKVLIVRPTTEKRVAHIEFLKKCTDPIRISDPPNTHPSTHDAVPTEPPVDSLYAGAGKVWVLGDDNYHAVLIPVDIRIIFRSPDGVLKFLGKYLYSAEHDPAHTYRLGTQPLFSINGKGPPIVSATVLGKHYYIADDGNEGNRRRNMTVLGLAEQLINLQKSASERPVTVPVQVVP